MKKTYTPTNEMRTNPLSVIPGGSRVVVAFEDYQVEYTNVKHPSSFIAKILEDKSKKIVSVYIDGRKATING